MSIPVRSEDIFFTRRGQPRLLRVLFCVAIRKLAMGTGVVGLLLTGLAGGDEVLVRPCAILQE
jgi:hypothetical protein